MLNVTKKLKLFVLYTELLSMIWLRLLIAVIALTISSDLSAWGQTMQVNSPEGFYDCKGVANGANIRDGTNYSDNCCFRSQMVFCGACGDHRSFCEKQTGVCGAPDPVCDKCGYTMQGCESDSRFGCNTTARKDTSGTCCFDSQKVCGQCNGSKPAVPKIVCKKTSFYPVVHPSHKFVQHYDLNFTAAECGGALPTSNYFGFLVNEEICGADTNWTVRTSPPGVGVDYWGACPSPASGSLVEVIWVSNSVGCPGSAPASSGSDVISRITSESPSITCRKTNFNPLNGGSAVRPITITFASSECSGGYPDGSYVGLISKRTICGTSESWTQPGAGMVSFWYKGSCSSPVAPSDIEVLYIKK